MKWIFVTAAAVGLTLTVSAASAQQDAPADNPSGGGIISRIEQFRQQHQTVSTLLQQLMQTVEAARSSNDPTQMHNALDQVHQALPSIQNETSTCSQVMSMCGQQQPMGGMMPGQGPASQPQS